ncbi:MAG: excinuclease ABC subunit C, partial [Clostridiales bacterium]
FFLLNAQSGEENILNNRFLWDYYGSGDKIPRHIYLNVLPENSKELMELFSETIGHKVDFLVPQRGDKKRLLNLVEKNAQLVLRQHLENSQYQEEKAALALEDLRRRLDLPKTPIRIECYDISHIQGSNTVGSMVVFSNGLADKRLYRHFKIKTVQGINDFASLQEVLRRRLQRGLDERAAAKEKLDFGIFPDLFLIDGGKGQLSAVGEVLSALGFGHIPVISLAEREEEVFIPQRSLPLDFPLDSDASKLLRRIRDEAHRFAITYHRNLRSKSQVTSFLDAAPGIGKARRQNLLQTFGSLEQIKKASLEELSQAPAMNKKVAGELYAFLHPHNQKEDI